MPIHQYQVKDQDSVVRICNADASSLSASVNATGRIRMKDAGGREFTASELVIYYINNAQVFTLTLTGQSPRVECVSLTDLIGSEPSLTYATNETGALVLSFGGASTNGSEAVWQFSHTAPPILVKVRVKRQADVISCS